MPGCGFPQPGIFGPETLLGDGYCRFFSNSLEQKGETGSNGLVHASFGSIRLGQSRRGEQYRPGSGIVKGVRVVAADRSQTGGQRGRPECPVLNGQNSNHGNCDKS